MPTASNGALAADSRQPGRFSPALLLLFVGSGCSAMIYEVVWFHLLRLIVGASAVSLAVLLGSFMAGMCIGSVAFPHIVPSKYHPIRVYALLEFGIGLMAVLIFLLLPFVSNVYVSWVGHGFGGVLVRGIVCAIFLLPPTIFMGATLPAIARWMENSPTGISRMGYFYGANIAGAVAGSAVAGFYLLRLFDVVVATAVALAINVTVAVVALVIARRSLYTPEAKETPEAKVKPDYPSVYFVTLLSGVTALGAEVLWTRQLSLLFGGTVYTFSLILAVYLAGLGIGSGAGSVMARFVRHGRFALAVCQGLLLLSIPWAAFSIIYLLPYMGVREYVESLDELHLGRVFVVDIVRTAFAILPSTILWGASFPLALAAVGSRGRDTGRLVGGMYGANTLGSIIGSLVYSLGAIAVIGSANAQKSLVVLAAVSALVLFVSMLRSAYAAKSAGEISPNYAWMTKGTLYSMSAIVVVLALLGLQGVPRVPVGLIAYGRLVDSWEYASQPLFIEEGMNASVAVTQFDERERRFHVAGKVVASNGINDIRVERVLGILPLVLHPEPKTVLIVGCGAGITAGTFVVAPSIERIVVCEIEPAVIRGAREHFADDNYNVLNDPRTEVIYDDGRHYLATTTETFDIISSDPIHPWARGVAALYSKEYYNLCRDRLNPGGLVTQWMPLYETSEPAVKSAIATFMNAFPYGTLWNTEANLGGYDLIMLGQIGPLKIDLNELRRRLLQQPRVARALAQIGTHSAAELMGTYAGQGPDLQEYLRGAPINRDRNLRLQYLAGAALDVDYRSRIHQEIVKYLQYPENIFSPNGD